MSNTEHINEISKNLGEPEWLLRWRNEESAKALTHAPDEKYGISITGLGAGEDPEFSASADYEVTPSKGLELYTWKEAVAQEEIAPILERLFQSGLIPDASSRPNALARACYRTGLVLYVQPTLSDKGEYQEESLNLTTTMPLGSASDIIVVIAKEGARAELASALSGGEDTSLFARTMIVVTEGDARVTVHQGARSARGTFFGESIALVAPHSRTDWVEDPESAMRYRSHTVSLLLGEKAESEILHTLIASSAASYDIWAGVEHRASDTLSRVYALGLAADTAKIVYRGLIDMKKGVAHVDGAQEGKFLILSPKAEIDAIPALDIASKEVVSSHKLSVSHIRDIDLFYARSRGIAEGEARELAIEGFFGSVFQKIKKSEIMESIRARIDRLARTN